MGLSVNRTTVLGPARASLAWRGNLFAVCTELQSPELSAQRVRCPCAGRSGEGLVAGNLDLALRAPPFALQATQPPGSGLSSKAIFAASGSLRGPLARPAS